MLDNIEVLTHSSIKITKDKNIYFDPYEIKEKSNDADIIFITHNHYDHFSKKDIELIKNEYTVFVVTKDVYEELIKMKINPNNIFIAEPYTKGKIGEIRFKTVPAYNINKQFHPKSNSWVGYILEIGDISYYIAGDTDVNEDILKIECDVAFVPVGGTYTMNYSEAASFINTIKPKIAVPTHYGSVVGTKEDGKKFVKLLNEEIEGKILIKTKLVSSLFQSLYQSDAFKRKR